MWLRILALVYDPFRWLGEHRGLRRRRSTLLEDAVGRVVEIGAGTGLNVEHYPDAVADLVLVEPDPAMRRRLGCNRPTVEVMRAYGFDVTADNVEWRGMPAIVRPLVVGRASRVTGG
jgi:hypothetical protein